MKRSASPPSHLTSDPDPAEPAAAASAPLAATSADPSDGRAAESGAQPELRSGELEPAPARIAELRTAAIAYVERALGYTISVDEDSLAFIDHYVTQVRGADGDLALRHKDDVVRLVAAALGVHLGQIAIRRFGGRWRALPRSAEALATSTTPAGEDDPRTDPTAWRVELDAAPIVFDPIGMAVLALRRPDLEGLDGESGTVSDGDGDGESDGADRPADPVGFVTRPELSEPLRAALSRTPPVTSDYYFSLTGRFETLCYVVELLIDLQQKKAEADQAQAAPAPVEKSPRIKPGKPKPLPN